MFIEWQQAAEERCPNELVYGVVSPHVFPRHQQFTGERVKHDHRSAHPLMIANQNPENTAASEHR
jgi:hypothetical protein